MRSLSTPDTRLWSVSENSAPPLTKARAGARFPSLISIREAPIIKQNSRQRQQVCDLRSGVENRERAFGRGLFLQRRLHRVFNHVQFFHFGRQGPFAKQRDAEAAEKNPEGRLGIETIKIKPFGHQVNESDAGAPLLEHKITFDDHLRDDARARRGDEIFNFVREKGGADHRGKKDHRAQPHRRVEQTDKSQDRDHGPQTVGKNPEATSREVERQSGARQKLNFDSVKRAIVKARDLRKDARVQNRDIMKLAPVIQLVVLLVLLPRVAFGQATLKVTQGTETVTIGGTDTFTVTVTNLGLQLPNSQLIATFPTSTTVSTPSPVSSLPNVTFSTTTAGALVFNIPIFPSSSGGTFTFTLKPGATGSHTNTIQFGGAAGVATNVITSVIAGSADIQVSLAGVPAAVLTNDVVNYTVTVHNAGPNAAPGVVVTNLIPTGTVLISESLPAEVVVTTGQIVWQAGNLAAGADRILSVLARFPTATNSTVSASAQAASTIDSAQANNVVTNSISIQPHVTNTLVITRGPQAFNRLNSLFEEPLTIKNIGAGTAVQPRLIISGVNAPDRLYQVSGTNGTTPFVTALISIPPGASVNGTNYFFFKNRQPSAGIVITAVEAPASTNVLVTATTNANFTASAPTLGTNGLVSFNLGTTAGRNYLIQSSDNVMFTNITSFQSFTNVATNFVQITDNPFPTNGAPIPARFFRAVETTR
jgi:uncharacterized repeat protein (TIGR01451 family)